MFNRRTCSRLPPRSLFAAGAKLLQKGAKVRTVPWETPLASTSPGLLLSNTWCCHSSHSPEWRKSIRHTVCSPRWNLNIKLQIVVIFVTFALPTNTSTNHVSKLWIPGRKQSVSVSTKQDPKSSTNCLKPFYWKTRQGRDLHYRRTKQFFPSVQIVVNLFKFVFAKSTTE